MLNENVKSGFNDSFLCFRLTLWTNDTAESENHVDDCYKLTRCECEVGHFVLFIRILLQEF